MDYKLEYNKPATVVINPNDVYRCPYILQDERYYWENNFNHMSDYDNFEAKHYTGWHSKTIILFEWLG